MSLLYLFIAGHVSSRPYRLYIDYSSSSYSVLFAILSVVLIYAIFSSGLDFSIELRQIPQIQSGVLEGPFQRGSVPSKRSGHSFTKIDKKVYLFGGYTEAGIAAGKSERKGIHIQVFLPQEAEYVTHEACLYQRRIFIFFDVWNVTDLDVFISVQCSDCEMHVLDLPDAPTAPLDVVSAQPPARDLSWTFLKQQAPCPLPREGHSATRHGKSIYIIGRERRKLEHEKHDV